MRTLLRDAQTAATELRGADVQAGPLLRIDLAAIASNTRLFAARATDLMAVVKADGFGIGATAMARTALGNGATSLGVTSVHEALALRDAGIAAPVLSWLNPVDTDFGTAIRRQVDLAVPSRVHLDAIARAAAVTGRAARVHLHVDCGMARDGSPVSLWPQLCDLARTAEHRGLVEVVGVMGHLGCAEDPWDPCNDTGRLVFERSVGVLRAAGLRPGVRHLAATSATLLDRRTHNDLSRVGAGLVGIDPTGTTELAQPLRLTAPVVSVREVPAGTYVGYGHAFRTSGPTRLALLPLGYADGLPRVASDGAEVLLNGSRCAVAGPISMDQVVVATGDLHIEPGDVATVLGGAGPSVADWAHWSGTLPHEIVTGFGPRVRRSHS